MPLYGTGPSDVTTRLCPLHQLIIIVIILGMNINLIASIPICSTPKMEADRGGVVDVFKSNKSVGVVCAFFMHPVNMCEDMYTCVLFHITYYDINMNMLLLSL